MPREDAGQIVGVLRSTALEQLGVGRHGRDRCAQLVRGVGDELAQVPVGLLQAGLGGHSGRERRLDPLQHDVEGPGQPTHLRRVVGAGHTLIEVSRRDGVGGALDVSEGRSPRRTSHQPPANASTSAPAVTASSMRKRVCNVSVVSPMGSATTS